ncbi:hypothetical protein TRIATDRAFT_285200 [Trichoderma atroviride IMI 206040]|uniref:Zn(2)-C6 fungal-type domain-containing protein n=1 Tax=Hypocrea atroviridis (strain ATCC 20476 / IMI 206040) TaxID=452589 RepID=G9P0K9_HYPAI|nr:uncharacterized protein TRIATDRAFT_285200 [Trichoderma atroviride IMI 206040]EHK42380.1 hypothetical protein TRIATDRAFT_285200 [Trichoderma atroviride IMI 206040]
MFSTFHLGNARGTRSNRRSPHALRACVRCRQARIKCSDERPCRPCKNSAKRCFDERPVQRSEQSPKAPDTNGVSRQVDHSASCHLEQSSSGLTYTRATSSKFFLEALGARLGESNLAHGFDPSLLELSPYIPQPFLAIPGLPSPLSGNAVGVSMDRQLEELLVSTFLQSYQIVAPILDASWLWTHFSSLWAVNSNMFRQRCPLIEIILALGTHQVLTLSVDDASYNAATLAYDPPGYDLFEISQMELLRRTTGPDLLTVQAYIYAAIYAGNLHSHYKAHQMLSLAVRDAYLLDLPSGNCSAEQPKGHISAKRTWLVLQMLDTVMSKESGLPFLIPMTKHDQVELGDFETTYDAVNHNGLSYLECFRQMNRLSQLIRQSTTDLDQICNQPSGPDGVIGIFYTSGASSVKTSIKAISTWFKAIPPALKSFTKDTSNNTNDNNNLDSSLDDDIPMWLHRQSLLLKMSYHMACLLLLRPFSLSPPATTIESSHHPISAELSIMCLKHAVSLTATLADNLNSGSFNVLAHATRFQWLAMLCLAGYVSTHTTTPQSTTLARRAVDVAVRNLERLAEHRVLQAREAVERARGLVEMMRVAVGRTISRVAQLGQPGDAALTQLLSSSSSGLVDSITGGPVDLWNDLSSLPYLS